MLTSRDHRVLTLATVAALALAILPPASASARSASEAGDYIVVLDRSVTSADIASVVQAARAAGATIGHTYTAALNGFSATLPARALAAVRATTGVAYVEGDHRVTADSQAADPDGHQDDPPWGLDRVDQRDLPLDATYRWRHTGAGVTAYVIDSGIRFSHVDFEGRAISGPDFVDDDEDSSDCSGHGTHVAGTVGGKTFGVAKAVTLVAIRVLGCSGTGTVSDVLAAFDWVLANAESHSVINLSLQTGDDHAVDDAIAGAFVAGILVAAPANAAGEDACAQAPGREPTAITVAASTPADARASFSSFGPCVDVFAPGVNIVSAGIASDTAEVIFSGTSMSAPHVAGGIALLVEKEPGADAQRITHLLFKASSKGKITNPGSGTPNRLLFTRRF